MASKLTDRARMLISCPDQPGIVAAVSQFLFERGANVIQSDQHTTNPYGGLFFMRVDFALPDVVQKAPALEREFATIADQFQMEFRLSVAERLKKVAIFVSKESHALQELIWQWKSGDIRAEIAMVISNHPDLAGVVEPFGIPFHVVPVTKETKAEAETKQLELTAGVDLVVLARYMQIISGNFISHFPHRVINIHHSFLPAFVGANPYAQAEKRGVKLIGATAHYVTEELDAGPIIEQDVQRVDHRSDVDDLRRLGRHVERVVLAKAVAWHLEDRVLVHGNKTVVFA
ncbi:MAG TPA: formyltetrahydrofolate deformylase [Symbiobacteriaceae bacterium]|jgi:formyltetrahydrofolate deformylase